LQKGVIKMGHRRSGSNKSKATSSYFQNLNQICKISRYTFLFVPLKISRSVLHCRPAHPLSPGRAAAVVGAVVAASGIRRSLNNGMGSAQSTERRRQNENESRATTRLLNQVN
jgi:hypothetical protein